MKSKKIFLIFIFGIFIFLLPNFTEAACPLSCEDSGTNCFWGPPYSWDPPNPNQRGGVERIGTIQNIGKTDYLEGTSYCSRSNGKCSESVFPSGSNGQVCVAHDQCTWGICSDFTKSGVWDTYESQCVICSGYKEDRILGYTSSKYCSNGEDHVCAGCGSEDGDPGDGKCESACGAASACDELSPQQDCGTGKKCNNSCQCETVCVCTSNTTGGCCDGCNYCSAGKVNNGAGSCVTPNSTYYCNSWEDCDNGDCSATKRWYGCTGTSETCSTTSYQSETVYASAGKVFTSSCGNQNATADVKCATTVNQCTAGDCSGEKRYPECQSGGTCDSSATTYYTSDPVYASAGKVLTSTCGNQDATATVKCASTVNKCTAGQCSGEKRYPECQSGGTCDSSATTYYTSDPVYASAGYSLTSSCGTTGSILCDSTWRASSGTGDNHYGKGGAYTCQGMCDSAGSCEYAANCGVCAGTLNVSISGAGTCTVTASLTASICDGQSWQIRDDGNIKCSGTVYGTPYPYTCSNWTVGVGSYVYNLYIGGVLKDSKLVTCSAAAFDFSISINPTSGSVNQGSSIPATVTATLTSGSTQSVSFSASGLPSGASASFSPSSCNPTCSSTMTINTAITTPTGTYSINVCGTGGGQTHCVTYGLTVTAVGAAINPPQVTTNGAANIASTSATLSGTLNNLGNATSCLVWFEWGTTTSYGNETPAQTMTSTGSFSADISGLTSNTTYYFKARAKNGGSW